MAFVMHSLKLRAETMPPDALPVRTGTMAQGASVQATVAVFLLLAWTTVVLRLYTRGRLVHNIGADDIWILVTVIFFTVYFIAVTICVHATEGTVWLRVGKVDRAFDSLITTECFYVVTMTTLKVSLAIFFLRIVSKPSQRWFIYMLLTFSTLINISYFFVMVFQCGVPRGGMKFVLKQLSGQCLHRSSMLGASYTHGVITTLTDIGFGIIPVQVVREMKLGFKETVTVVGILTLAALGGIASIVRLAYVPRLATPTERWFMDANLIAIWSAVEPGLGIIASSLATLRPLFRGLFRTGLTSDQSYQNGFGNTANSAYFPGKNGTAIEELPAQSDGKKLTEGSAYDSYEFIQGSLPSMRGPPPPHKHIEKEPWRPGLNFERRSGSRTRASNEQRARNQQQTTLERRPSGRGRMGKAEELLGEDLSAFDRSKSPPAPVPIARSQVRRIDQNVRFEGPPVRLPEPQSTEEVGSPGFQRSTSRSKLHEYQKQVVG